MDAQIAAAALAFDHVSYSYAGAAGMPVVRDVSLAVAPGEMLGLLGPNGAGKSTLLKLAAGVLRPTQGEIALHGARLRSLSRQEIARRVAVVPQDFSVQFAYTVRQIVEMGRMPHRGGWGIPHATDREVITAALQETNTVRLADRIFNELSGGERQRALLALALAQDANVILLDEPTAHLDIKHQIEVLELLRRLNAERGLTVVAVLHDLNLAARYFPRLALFQREIVADGPPAQVLDSTLLSTVYETVVQVGILRGEEHLSVLPPGYAAVGDGASADAGDVRTVGKRALAHVIAGGGSGELLMRALADARIPFSAGPLNVGDSDYALAQRLAALCIAEPPYAPVSAQGLAAACERIAEAGTVVLCPTPLGNGNIALIEAALDALRTGARVIVLEPGSNRTDECERDVGDTEDNKRFADVAARDFSGKGAALYRELVAAGALWAGSPGDVVALIQRAERELLTI